MKMFALPTFLAALVLSSATMLFAQAASNPAGIDSLPKISVSGEAVVYVRPDKVIIRFSIEARDKDVGNAKNEAAEVTNKAIAAFQECGVSKKDIQVSQSRIERHLLDSERPYFQKPSKANVQANQMAVPADVLDSNRDGRPMEYVATKTLAVTVSDPGKVEELLTKGFQAGVDQVLSVEYQNDDINKHRENSRRMAAKSAQEKAKQLADSLGQDLGPALHVNVSGESASYGIAAPSNDHGPFAYGRQYPPPPTLTGNSFEISAGGPDNLTLFGKIAVCVSVNVDFLLKEKKQ